MRGRDYDKLKNVLVYNINQWIFIIKKKKNGQNIINIKFQEIIIAPIVRKRESSDNGDFFNTIKYVHIWYLFFLLLIMLN